MERVAVDADHLHDLRRDAAGDLVDLLEPGDLGGRLELRRRALRAVATGAVHASQVDHGAGRVAAKRRARRLRGLEERPAIETVRVRVPVGRSSHDAHPSAAIVPRRELLHLPVVQTDRGRGPLLAEHFGEVAPPSSSVTEHFVDELPGEHAGDAIKGLLPRRWYGRAPDVIRGDREHEVARVALDNVVPHGVDHLQRAIRRVIAFDVARRYVDGEDLRAHAAAVGRKISAERAAPYLIQCLEHMTGRSEDRPTPPWKTCTLAARAKERR